MKKNVISENYLEKVPVRNDGITFSVKENLVTLEIQNKGFFNKIAQILFKKPKISYVHLDKMGSFIWPLLDGEKNILEIGNYVEEEFKEEAHPLYERLAKYFQILKSYNFITFK